MSPWLFNAYLDGVKKDVKMGLEGGEILGGGKRVEITWSLVCK